MQINLYSNIEEWKGGEEKREQTVLVENEITKSQKSSVVISLSKDNIIGFI